MFPILKNHSLVMVAGINSESPYTLYVRRPVESAVGNILLVVPSSGYIIDVPVEWTNRGYCAHKIDVGNEPEYWEFTCQFDRGCLHELCCVSLEGVYPIPVNDAGTFARQGHER